MLTKDNITEHLIIYQLNMINKNIDEARVTDNWYSVWTMTEKQFEEFKKYAILQIKKVTKYNKKEVENLFNYFNLQYGLKISQ